jgi:Tol biopolymer transport system component
LTKPSAVALALTLIVWTAPSARAGQVELISRVAPDQVSATATGSAFLFLPPPSSLTSLSADGRYVAFVSAATNLVPGQDDRNGSVDVFLRDRVTATTLLVSRSAASATVTANNEAFAVTVSPDGRYVAWAGLATDVVDPPGGFDVPWHLFLFDRVSGTNRLLGPGDHPVAFSRDGRFLFFFFDSFVPGGGAFLYDVTSGALTRASSNVSGVGAPTEVMSADGRYVVFVSGLYHLLVFDRIAGTLEDLGIGSLPAISADGRYVAFLSSADNLVPGQVDNNFGLDAFLYDRVTRTTVLVSHTLDSPLRTGDQDLQGQYITLSSDGRYVAFVSRATYELPPQPNAPPVVILFDRTTGAVKVVAPTYGDALFDSPVFSADGRSLVFSSRADVIPGRASHGASNVFLHDPASGRTTPVTTATAESPLLSADDDSYGAAISDDGRVVAFTSRSTDLVPGLKDLNEGADLFAYTVPTGATEAVTRRASPAATPARGSRVRSLSADGRWTAFMSASSHLISGQVDHQTSIYNTARTDIFLYDAQTHASQLVSRANGTLTTTGNDDSVEALLSGDGRYVAFVSLATNLTPEAGAGIQNSNLFLFDRIAGTTGLVSRSLTGESYDFAIPTAFTADGRFLAFTSNSLHLVPGQTPGTPHSTSDVFLYDRVAGALTLVSHSTAGAHTTGNGPSSKACLSADGRYVLFSSEAIDLVPGQTGSRIGSPDVFLHDRITGVTTLVSHTRTAKTEASGGASYAQSALSADGRYAVFTSPRGDLAANATGETFGGNLYLHDRTTATNTLLLSIPGPGKIDNALISGDGRIIAFLGMGTLVPGQTGPSGQAQLFLYDRIARTTTLASRAGGSATTGADGGASDPALSPDGRYVTFLGNHPRQSGPPENPDVFRFDRVTGATVLASPSRRSAGTGAGGSRLPPLISADGQTVAFTSTSPDLVEADDNGNEEDAFLFHAASPPAGPVTVPPCTLLDTRRPGDGPALRSNVRRSVKATGTCGVPAAAKSVLVKVTALQGTGKGNLQLFPGGSTISAGILRFAKGQTRSVSFTVPVGADGTIAILPYVAGNGTVQSAVEVDAYNP